MKKSKIFALVMTAAMIFTFAGCGSDEGETSASADMTTVQEELSAETPDSELSADPEADTEEEAAEKEDSSSVTSSGNADKPSQSVQKPSTGSGSSSGSSSNTGNSGSSGSGSNSGNSGSGSGTPSAPSKATAQSYIGKSASALIAAIGAPSSSQYSPSCMGDGEDGQLTYNGFTVYTYRENGQERVVDVE